MREYSAPDGDRFPGVYIHPTSLVDETVHILEGTKIWHFSHIMGFVTIGTNCVIGQNVVIGPRVSVGNGVRIQNNVSVYEGVTLEDDVFCGPSCVFTNVANPRAFISRKDEFRTTRVGRGASIGANATIVCGHNIGDYSFIGAGSVVTKEVMPYSLMVGNPARRIGWVSVTGEKLGADLICPKDKSQYRLVNSERLEKIK